MFSTKYTVAAVDAVAQAVDAGAREKESSGEEVIEVGRGNCRITARRPAKPCGIRIRGFTCRSLNRVKRGALIAAPSIV